MQASAPDIGLYATALATLGEAAGAAEQIERDIAAALDLLERDPHVRWFLGDPAVGGEGKRRALESLLATRVHPVLLNFLLLLADVGRLPDLRAIADAFYAQTSARRRKAAGEVLSAAPLPADILAAIEAEAGRLLGKDVRLRPRVDPALIGGLLVRVEDFVIDGTLDRRLDAIRYELLKPAPTPQATPHE